MLYQQLRIPATRDESAPIPRHAACYGIPHNATFHRRIRFILGQWSACFMNHNSVPLTVQLVKTVKSARDSRGQRARSGPAVLHATTVQASKLKPFNAAVTPLRLLSEAARPRRQPMTGAWTKITRDFGRRHCPKWQRAGHSSAAMVSAGAVFFLAFLGLSSLNCWYLAVEIFLTKERVCLILTLGKESLLSGV